MGGGGRGARGGARRTRRVRRGGVRRNGGRHGLRRGPRGRRAALRGGRGRRPAPHRAPASSPPAPPRPPSPPSHGHVTPRPTRLRRNLPARGGPGAPRELGRRIWSPLWDFFLGPPSRGRGSSSPVVALLLPRFGARFRGRP